MSVDAVLFDLDGTLLDTAPDFETALNHLLAEEGKPPLEANAIRNHVGNGSAGIVARVFDIPRDSDEFRPLQLRFLEHYKTFLIDRTRIFPGLETSIEFLDMKQIPWGIVTNKPSEYAAPIVEALLSGSRVLICPDHVTTPKPDPEGILLACEEINIRPQRSLYIGDHLRDIQAGQAAGTPTVAVGWGYIGDEENHTEWNADWVADNPEDLAPLLNSILTN